MGSHKVRKRKASLDKCRICSASVHFHAETESAGACAMLPASRRMDRQTHMMSLSQLPFRLTKWFVTMCVLPVAHICAFGPPKF